MFAARPIYPHHDAGPRSLPTGVGQDVFVEEEQPEFDDPEEERGQEHKNNRRLDCGSLLIIV